MEVTGSNPVAPTNISAYRTATYGRLLFLAGKIPARWESLSGLRRGFACQQLFHVLLLCIQRLGKISVGVDGGHLGPAVTEQGLGDCDVLSGFVRPRAQAVAETVPGKTLTVGYQPQSHDGWLKEVGVHGLTPQRLLSLQRTTVSGVTRTIDFFDSSEKIMGKLGLG